MKYQLKKTKDIFLKSAKRTSLNKALEIPYLDEVAISVIERNDVEKTDYTDDVSGLYAHLRAVARANGSTEGEVINDLLAFCLKYKECRIPLESCGRDWKRLRTKSLQNLLEKAAEAEKTSVVQLLASIGESYYYHKERDTYLKFKSILSIYRSVFI